MKKITVIGAGNVGATIAYTIAAQGVASELVLVDINTAKADGEAMDMNQAMPFFKGCKVYRGEYPDTKGSDIVIFSSGVGRKPGQSRLDLAQINVNITKSVVPLITEQCPNAYYIIVANPVDILTYTFLKCSNLRPEQVMGSGTLLDTARLVTRVADDFDMMKTDVGGYVLGEHGDSSFVAWSTVNIDGIPLDKCNEKLGKEVVIDKEEIATFVKKSGGYIIERKGATFYGIAASVTRMCECLLGGIDTIMPVSTMMNGEYGISDVCLSVPTVIGGNPRKVVIDLPEDELAKLRHSADCLKEVINSVQI